jgi:phage terminase large subunit GpA-like protein
MGGGFVSAPSALPRAAIIRRRFTVFALAKSAAIFTLSKASTARARSGLDAPGKVGSTAGSNVGSVGVDMAKDAIYSKLKVEAPRPGYCHFPDVYQREYFEQLTSEEVRTHFVRGHPVRYWFKPSGLRNEALDRRVYALAALHARAVPLESGLSF